MRKKYKAERDLNDFLPIIFTCSIILLAIIYVKSSGVFSNNSSSDIILNNIYVEDTIDRIDKTNDSIVNKIAYISTVENLLSSMDSILEFDELHHQNTLENLIDSVSILLHESSFSEKDSILLEAKERLLNVQLNINNLVSYNDAYPSVICFCSIQPNGKNRIKFVLSNDLKMSYQISNNKTALDFFLYKNETPQNRITDFDLIPHSVNSGKSCNIFFVKKSINQPDLVAFTIEIRHSQAENICQTFRLKSHKSHEFYADVML